MASCRALRNLANINRLASSSRSLVQTSLRCCSTGQLEVPAADGTPKNYPPHIVQIVDQISKLTVLEVSELNSCLKTALNISDAPVMPMMGMAAPAQPGEEEEEKKPEIQTLFNVTIDKFDDSKKVALIKEVKKHMEGMNLVQAKKFVEACPALVKEGMAREEAEALGKTLEESGASVTIA